jgi:hypothetical protein
MSKKLFLLAAFALPLFFTSCGGEKPTETEDVIPAGMRAVVLDGMGLPVKINAPDSSAGILDTMSTPNGAQVRVGNNFDLLVNLGGAEEADLAQVKSLVEATDAGEYTFTVNDATTLVWETKFGDLSMYHFYTVVKVGNDTYYVRDNADNPNNQFKKEDIDRMLEASKSLRASKAPVEETEA